VSAVESTIWIAGGVDEAGQPLDELLAYYAADARWMTVPTDPRTLRGVRALAWSPSDRRLYALDEITDAHHARFTRLVSIAPDGSGAREEVRWRQTVPYDVYVLSVDELGHVWLGASRSGIANHTIGRLSRGSAGAWVVDGVLEAGGSLQRDGAYANERGLSVAVVEGPRTRIVGYAAGQLHAHSGLSPWL
jgi:hypothetical protein